MKLHNRQIKASFWTDTEMICNFSLEERLFYIGLWQLSDDSGCLENNSQAFKLFLFPLNHTISFDLLTIWVNKLIEHHKLIPYHEKGKRCLYLTNFHRHQTLKNPQAPEVPLPPWITWKVFTSNPRSGRYEITPQDDSTPTSPQEPISTIPQPVSAHSLFDEPPMTNSLEPPSSPLLPEPPPSSDPVLTSIFQIEIEHEREINLEEEPEPEEERGCKGKGETRSALAESGTVIKGERNSFKNVPIQNPTQAILDFYNQEFQGLWKGKLRLTKERECQIKARLKTFTREELTEAIASLRRSSFHCGNNDKEKVYATPEFLFRNDSQVDKWLNEKPRSFKKKRDDVWARYRPGRQTFKELVQGAG